MTITLPDNVNDNPDRVFISLRLKLRFDFLLAIDPTPIEVLAMFLLILRATSVCPDCEPSNNSSVMSTPLETLSELRWRDALDPPPEFEPDGLLDEPPDDPPAAPIAATPEIAAAAATSDRLVPTSTLELTGTYSSNPSP